MPSHNKNITHKTPQHDGGVQNKTVKKMDKETMESKLERLRSKYGKMPKENQKKAPIMVEPHRDAKPEESKKEGFLKAEEVIERLSVWITPKTVEYIDKQTSPEPLTPEDMSPEHAVEVPTEQVVENPCSYSLRSKAKKEEPKEDEIKPKEEEIKPVVKLPPVDKVDQHARRVETVLSGLKKAWVSYVGQLKIGYPVNNTKKLISTFALDKENCVIDPKISEYFATAILQMMTHCSTNLKELLHREETLEYHQKYYEFLEIDFNFFDTKLTELIDSKRQELAATADDE
uniref:Uncharacterized protein n=1 Tax=Panagrolaimus superbus TaxID=310955 RepID=A0A914Y2W0_9BILA